MILAVRALKGKGKIQQNLRHLRRWAWLAFEPQAAFVPVCSWRLAAVKAYRASFRLDRPCSTVAGCHTLGTTLWDSPDKYFVAVSDDGANWGAVLAGGLPRDDGDIPNLQALR